MDALFNAACSLMGITSFDPNFFAMYTKCGIQARLTDWQGLFDQFVATSRENPMLSLALRMRRAETIFNYRIKTSDIPRQLVITCFISLIRRLLTIA